MISFSKEDIFLVTGASSGIGKATALLFNQLGATVIATGRDESKLSLLVNEASNKDSFFVEVKDLSENISDQHKWIKTLKDKYGKLKGLVCSAGVTETEPLSVLDYVTTKYVFDINYMSPLMLIKGFADKRNNSGKDNTIVYISSFAIYRGNKGQIAYAGSKGAFLSSMKVIANELLHKNIRINSVSPSYTNTPMVTEALENNQIYKLDAHKYIATPKNIADIVIFLSSNKSEWINAQDIVANRGAYYYMQQM